MTAATVLPVPYIAPRSAEKIDLEVVLARYDGATDGRRLSYLDPVEDDWQLGVLWARQESHRRGTPLWDQVHPLRQRECMLNELCQVCGESALDASSGRLWWVFPRPAPSASLYATKPATCLGCIPRAIRSCPRLRTEAHVYTSGGEYQPYGVLGDVVITNPDGGLGSPSARTFRWMPSTGSNTPSRGRSPCTCGIFAARRSPRQPGFRVLGIGRGSQASSPCPLLPLK